MFSLAEFNQLVETLGNGKPTDIAAAQNALSAMVHQESSWQTMLSVLTSAVPAASKHVALTILQGCINSRWKLLPENERHHIRGIIVDQVIQLCLNHYSTERVVIHKMNATLVDIVKQDWPEQWPSFIPDLVGSCKASNCVCANNLDILALLSEHIFNYSSKLTSVKVEQLKQSFQKDFAVVFQLCTELLLSCDEAFVLIEALKALEGFLCWLPESFVFETPLIEILGTKFLPRHGFELTTLGCLEQIANIETSKAVGFTQNFQQLFLGVMEYINTALPAKGIACIAECSAKWQDASEEEQQVLAHMCSFLLTFLKNHLVLIEHSQPGQVVLALWKILGFTAIEDADELALQCMEFWVWMTEDVHQRWKSGGSVVASQDEDAQLATLLSAANTEFCDQRGEVFKQLQQLLICTMAKPQESVLTVNDAGELVREELHDVTELYNNMRECLVFLTHLDAEGMERVILQRLSQCYDEATQQPHNWSPEPLTKLCWAIGSISGAMTVTTEANMVGTVMVCLIELCEVLPTHPSTPLVEANLLYVVGQYPRFLSQNRDLLQKVLAKVTERLHLKTIPPLQDMAVDTLAAICKGCKASMLTADGGAPSFAELLLGSLFAEAADLSHTQVQVLFEAVGTMLRAATDSVVVGLLAKMFHIPNAKWQEIVAGFYRNPASLVDGPTLATLMYILRLNSRVAKSLGNRYFSQFQAIARDLVMFYKALSECMAQELARAGHPAVPPSGVYTLRHARREILRLLQQFVMRTELLDFVQFVLLGPVLEMLLADYSATPPVLRDEHVLALLTVLIERCSAALVPHLSELVARVVLPTIDMLSANFDDFPDIRPHFHLLLKHAVFHRFEELWPQAQADGRILQIMLWGAKHPLPQIAELSLTTLGHLVRAAEASPHAATFFPNCFLPILAALLGVIFDGLHSAGLDEQSALLEQLVATGLRIGARLSPDQPEGVDNIVWLHGALLQSLGTTCPTLTPQLVEALVAGVLQKGGESLKGFLRDFVVRVATFQSDDAELVYEQQKEERERKEQQARRVREVPGLSRAAEDDDLMDIFKGMRLSED